MTKYILHGGATSKKPKNNKKFFFEMTKGLSEPVNVLCIYFARERKLWHKLFKQDKENFFSASPQKKLNFILADDAPDVLCQQLKDADVIYMRGGSNNSLKKPLSKIKNLADIWKDKVVAGSSAGAYVLSKYYYTNTRDCIEEGIGILPIKTFCHYTAEKLDKLEQLKRYAEDLPIYKIPEENFLLLNNKNGKLLI